MTLDGPLTGYDPAKAGTFQDAVAVAALYDTLVYLDKDGKLIAGLADSWKSTATSATFHLRPGVSCSDGSALSAKTVAASLNRLFDPATKSSLVTQAIGAGNTAKATATGDSVTITLARPWSDLLAGMAGPYAAIVCENGLADPTTLSTKPSGTGAFVAESQVTGSTYTMTRRSDYSWGPKYSAPAAGDLPKKLVLKVVDDENTRANLMATGDLQIGSFSSDGWKRFESAKGIDIEKSAQSDTMLFFNESSGHPTADKAVRIAIAQAVDRAALNKVQSFGEGELLTSIGQSSYECFDPDSPAQLPKADPAAAAQALKGVSLRIIGTNILAGGDANDYLQATLQAAGATVTVNTMDNQAWVSDLFAGKNDWDLTIFVYGNRLSSLVQVGNFMVGSAPPKGLNIGAIDNPAAAAAFAKATISGAEQKCDRLVEFQQALLKNSDVLPLATSPVHVVLAGGVTGSVVKGFAAPNSIRIATPSG